MLVHIGSLCTLVLLALGLGLAKPRSIETPANPLEASIRPIDPLIEVRDRQQIVNVDMLVRNRSAETLQLIAIRLAVFDRRAKLEIEREINQNGKPPALAILGELRVAPDGVIDLFQPFTTFGSSVDLTTMRFTLLFGRPGQETSAVPLTAAASLIVEVHPKPYSPVAYCLPLSGLAVVHDGHDLLSHHRRFDLSHRFQIDPTSAVSANLYAYDLVRTRTDGTLYGGDFTHKENWFSYGVPVRAPAGGTVVAAVNDIGENTFTSSGNPRIPPEAEARDPDGFGNYVVIRHTDSRVSWLLHMQPGSVTVHLGEAVHAGQILGKIGFSGDSLFPHLHYTVTSAAVYPSQGVPSYFRSFTKVLGSQRVRVPQGQVDTGDLIVSDPSCK